MWYLPRMKALFMVQDKSDPVELAKDHMIVGTRKVSNPAEHGK